MDMRRFREPEQVPEVEGFTTRSISSAKSSGAEAAEGFSKNFSAAEAVEVPVLREDPIFATILKSVSKRRLPESKRKFRFAGLSPVIAAMAKVPNQVRRKSA